MRAESGATGEVIAVHLNHGSRAPLHAVERAVALVDRGLDGDRHANRSGGRRQVLMMEQEVLDDFGLKPGDVREQLTVRGVPLGDLAQGTRLRIGSALFEVGHLCDPCERMEELQPGLQAALEGRRGRFLRVVSEGTIAVGDSIEEVDTP
jgi:MOSC domain-containing protein YiiM